MDLVGRFLQTDAVDRLLGRAASGTGGVLVVYGPPGSGRTALADLAVRLGADRGFDVVRGTQVRGRSGRRVWAQLLRDVGAFGVADGLLDDGHPVDTDEVAAAFHATSPRLVVIDDLDHGGPEAVDLLAALAGRAAASAVAVVVTATEPPGIGEEVWLDRLTPAQIAAVTGEERAAVIEAIWTASHGRPGPARALTRLLGTLDPDQDPVVGLALSVTSAEGFLDLDVGLIRLLDTALRLVPAGAGDDRSRALLLARLASALLGDAGQAGRRRALADEALVLARADGDRALLAEVLDARLHALWDSAGVYDRLDSAAEIIDLARRSADPDRERRGLFWRFVALMELARVGEAEAVLTAFAREARIAGDRQDEVMAVARYAMLATLRGSFDEAAALIDQASTDGHQAGMADTDRLVGTLRSVIAGLRGEQPPDGGAAEIALLRAFDRRIPGHFYDATVAFVLAHRGRLDEARLELARALPRLLAGSGPRWLGAAVELADVAARTRAAGEGARLLDALTGYRGRLVMFAGANTTMGPVDHWVGVLAASLGRLDEAVDWLGRAADLAERIGGWPFLAFTLEALANALAARARAGDERLATGHRVRAAELARQLGLAELEAALTPRSDRWALRQDEDGWELVAGPERVRLPDSRGMGYLRALLAAPGHDIPCTDLAADGAGLVVADAAPVLDDQARAAYRRRLAAVQHELDDADARGDVTRSTAAEAERAALLAELGRVAGLGRRPRRMTAEDERARVNVTRTLRATLARISTRAPLAGAHLTAAITTGRACRYQPTRDGPTGWLV